MSNPYSHTSEADLRGLLSSPQVGDVAKERIRAELARRSAGLVVTSMTEDVVRIRSAPKADTMNGWEAKYATELAADPTIREWRFNSVRIRLADGAWYKPDFYVTRYSGKREMHEVKGHMRSRDRLKIKVAAAEFPEFEFRVVRKKKLKDGGGWDVEVIRSREREEWLRPSTGRGLSAVVSMEPPKKSTTERA